MLAVGRTEPEHRRPKHLHLRDASALSRHEISGGCLMKFPLCITHRKQTALFSIVSLMTLAIAPLGLMLAIVNTPAYGQTSGDVSNSATAINPSLVDWTQFHRNDMRLWNPAMNPHHTLKAYGRLPLSFEANQGQTDSRVRFLSHVRGCSLFLTQEEAVLAFQEVGKRALLSGVHSGHVDFAERGLEPMSESVLRMRLAGANATAQMMGLEELPGKSNYFIGNDSTKWRSGVPNYEKVKYTNVYPGVDLVYYGNQRQLEFDLVIQPGADPRTVRLDFRTGASGKHAAMRVNDNGDLVVGAKRDEVIFHKPIVYQPATNDGALATHEGVIDGKFIFTRAHQVGFKIGAYDKTKPLIIDPTLAYSTYLGGSAEDEGGGIAVDTSGNAYVTGETHSSNFPTTSGAFNTTLKGGEDVFITKLNAAGSAVLYSTYLGGNGGEIGRGIAVDAAGNAYVSGITSSADFPVTPGAFQTTYGGNEDAFVSKLNAAGSVLIYSTYLGGSAPDGDFDGGGGNIAIDAAGNAYVTGETISPNFPTTSGAFQPRPGPGAVQDAFVSKLNATGSALVYSTYLGSADTAGFGIAVDAVGNAYVAGFTNSAFPTTPGAFSEGGNGLIIKLNASGSALVYAARLKGYEVCSGIAVDAAGNAYVTGHTTASDFPTTQGAFQTVCGGCSSAGVVGDAFVTKLNPSGSTLVYSTFLGGTSDEGGNGIAIDAAGNTYISGSTVSSNFPTTKDAFQTTFGGSGGSGDAFFSKLNAAGSGLLYSTYLGGNNIDNSNGIAVDAGGGAYVAGYSFSSNFPTTTGAFQTAFHGTVDAFISKFSFSSADLFLRIFPSATTVHQGDLLTFAFPVWNLGPGVAEGEVLSNLQVPAGTTFDYLRISGTPGLGTCTHPPYGGTGQIICHEGDGMAPNTTWTVRLTVKVTAPAGTVITANAATMSDTPDPNLANNTATVSLTVQ